MSSLSALVLVLKMKQGGRSESFRRPRVFLRTSYFSFFYPRVAQYVVRDRPVDRDRRVVWLDCVILT